MTLFRRYAGLLLVLLLCVSSSVLAADTAKDIGGIAGNVTTTLFSIGKLMVAVAYVAGFGFLMFGVLKLKQHRDNPSQIPLGTPIVMILIGVVLVFIGGFIAPLGETLGVDTDTEGAGSYTGFDKDSN